MTLLNKALEITKAFWENQKAFALGDQEETSA